MRPVEFLFRLGFVLGGTKGLEPAIQNDPCSIGKDMEVHFGDPKFHPFLMIAKHTDVFHTLAKRTSHANQHIHPGNLNEPA
jgi:hypothetical protein